MRNAVVPLVPVVLQSAQPVKSTKVQASFMAGYTIQMTYQDIPVYETCHQGVIITDTIDVILFPLKGNGTGAYVCV